MRPASRPRWAGRVRHWWRVTVLWSRPVLWCSPKRQRFSALFRSDPVRRDEMYRQVQARIAEFRITTRRGPEKGELLVRPYQVLPIRPTNELDVHNEQGV